MQMHHFYRRSCWFCCVKRKVAAVCVTVVVSSPLVLGMDMTNETVMAQVWSYVSNPEALAVNQAFEGDPGTLVYPHLPPPDSGAEPMQRGEVAAATPVEVWAKGLPNGAVALLAINTDSSASADLQIKLAPILGKPVSWCATGDCEVRDVWRQVANGTVGVGGVWSVVDLAPHDSHFVVVSPPTHPAKDASTKVFKGRA